MLSAKETRTLQLSWRLRKDRLRQGDRLDIVVAPVAGMLSGGGGKIVVCLDKTFYSLWVRETTERDMVLTRKGPQAQCSEPSSRSILEGGPAGPEKLSPTSVL